MLSNAFHDPPMLDFGSEAPDDLEHEGYDASDGPNVLQSCMVSILHHELGGGYDAENVKAALHQVYSIVEKGNSWKHDQEFQSETDQEHDGDA